MSYSRKIKIAAMVLATAFVLGACKADGNKIMEDVNKIGSAIQDMTTGTEVSDVVTNEETEPAFETIEPEETEGEEETAPSETDAKKEEDKETVPEVTKLEATPSPTPTPEPTPEVASRVDFSELTEIELSEDFKIEKEDFEESYGSEDEVFVSFTGDRMLITMPDNEVPAKSMNLLLDSFYKEAEGIYNKYSSEAEAQYELNEVVENIVNIEVHYTYTTNNRILAVKMEYKVTINDETETVTEIELFDMLTAARIINAGVTNNVNAFEETMFAKFEDLKIKSYDQIVLIPDEEDEFIIWMLSDGEFYKEHIATEDIAGLLNRYGALVYTVE